MASIGELTVDVKLSIDERTALTALKIVELYTNQTNCEVIGHREYDDSINLEYKRMEPSKEDA